MFVLAISFEDSAFSWTSCRFRLFASCSPYGVILERAKIVRADSALRCQIIDRGGRRTRFNMMICIVRTGSSAATQCFTRCSCINWIQPTHLDDRVGGRSMVWWLSSQDGGKRGRMTTRAAMTERRGRNANDGAVRWSDINERHGKVTTIRCASMSMKVKANYLRSRISYQVIYHSMLKMKPFAYPKRRLSLF